MNPFEELLALARSKGLSLGSVESMSGGLFGAKLCSVSGASSVYAGGLITYASREKTRLADVDLSLIEERGLVSEEVARAMAIGGRKALDVDIAVSITGNAGPGICDDKPVGCAYIGLASKEKVSIIPCSFSGDRNSIREQAAQKMAEAAISFIQEN